MKEKFEFDQKQVGNRLKKIRKSLDRTLNQMAEISRLSVSTIGEMETGKNKPNHDYLLLLANKFNINLNWVFTGKGAMVLPDFEIKWDFGQDTLLAQKLIYLLERSPEVRFSVLAFFARILETQKDSIENYLYESDKTGTKA